MGVPWRLFTPQLVDESLGAHDLVRVEEQQREHSSSLRARDLDRPIAVEDLQRAEDPKLHLAPTVAPAKAAENP
jgi:hypothetical protein